MPKRVHAHMLFGKWHDIEVEDDVTVFVEYENGATGTFTTSTGEFPGTNRLEIAGTLGKLIVEDGKLKWWKLNRDARDFCKESDACYLWLCRAFRYLRSPLADQLVTLKGVDGTIVNAFCSIPAFLRLPHWTRHFGKRQFEHNALVLLTHAHLIRDRIFNSKRSKN